uniref:Uncharacterized protein n=1 Tax=Glossina brevipalpis TaxID=37001 RepID=A0A1A9W0F9_9MUSC
MTKGFLHFTVMTVFTRCGLLVELFLLGKFLTTDRHIFNSIFESNLPDINIKIFGNILAKLGAVITISVNWTHTKNISDKSQRRIEGGVNFLRSLGLTIDARSPYNNSKYKALPSNNFIKQLL